MALHVASALGLLSGCASSVPSREVEPVRGEVALEGIVVADYALSPGGVSVSLVNRSEGSVVLSVVELRVACCMSVKLADEAGRPYVLRSIDRNRMVCSSNIEDGVTLDSGETIECASDIHGMALYAECGDPIGPVATADWPRMLFWQMDSVVHAPMSLDVAPSDRPSWSIHGRGIVSRAKPCKWL